MFKAPRPDGADLIGALLVAFAAAATILWLSLDRLPPNWDDAWYLTNSLAVYDALAHGGVAAYLAKLNSVLGFKAPLIAALPTPFYLVFGRRWQAAYLVNIVSMVVLSLALYRIAWRFWNKRAALFAIAIAATMPLLYGLARWYMVEYALTSLVAFSIWLLIESQQLERRGLALLFGVACGFGLLLKISFAAFILPPFLYVWLQSRRRIRSLLLIALPCCAVAMPWYAGHLQPTLENALAAGFGESAVIQGTGPIFSLRTIVTYLAHLAASGVSGYYAVLMALLLAWAACRHEGRVVLRSLTRKPVALILFWLIPFVIFLFGGNKDIRYVAPILPALALLLACMLDFALRRNHQGTLLAVLILAFPITSLLSVSFGIPWRANGLTYARHYNREPWFHDEILELIAADDRLKPGEKDLLLVGADRAALNADNVELAVVEMQLPFVVETTAHEKNLDTLRQRLAQASYFLYKEGGEPESPVLNPHIDDLAQLVTHDAQFREIPFERQFPDGGKPRIFKNLASNLRAVEGRFVKSAPPEIEDFAIDFAGMLALTNATIVRLPDSIVIRFRWRCLKPPDRDYKCFTHVVDAAGRTVAQLDHQLLGGVPPLRSWRTGDAGLEEMRLRVPGGLDVNGLRLRFGFYDPRHGDRLSIGILQGAAATRFQLADEATALLSPI